MKNQIVKEYILYSLIIEVFSCFRNKMVGSISTNNTLLIKVLMILLLFFKCWLVGKIIFQNISVWYIIQIFKSITNIKEII